MPNVENYVALGRYIDRAPQWFGGHFSLFQKLYLPLDNGEIQLYRREGNYTPQEISELCDFWISYHLSEKELWPQIRALWRFSSQEEMGSRSLAFIQAADPANRDAWQTLLRADQERKLWPYEKLQFGAWAIERKEKSLGERLLLECVSTRSYCSARAAMELAAWYQKNGKNDTAENYYRNAWRLNPERPEPLEKLWNMAKQNKEAQKEIFFDVLQKQVISYLHLNRRRK